MPEYTREQMAARMAARREARAPRFTPEAEQFIRETRDEIDELIRRSRVKPQATSAPSGYDPLQHSSLRALVNDPDAPDGPWGEISEADDDALFDESLLPGYLRSKTITPDHPDYQSYIMAAAVIEDPTVWVAGLMGGSDHKAQRFMASLTNLAPVYRPGHEPKPGDLLKSSGDLLGRGTVHHRLTNLVDEKTEAQ